jgi:hypothetical protein
MGMAPLRCNQLLMTRARIPVRVVASPGRLSRFRRSGL